MTQPLYSDIISDISAIELINDRFAAGEGRFLAYQANKTLPSTARAQSSKAGSARGTVFIFHDWGLPFNSDKGLLAALSARGFYTIGYDWYRQSSLPKAGSGKIAAENRYICRFDHEALSRFLQYVLLPEYPAPFYILAQGLGALFALSAQNILCSAVSRMVLIALPMSINGHMPNSLYHYGLKALNFFARQSKKRKDTTQHSLVYKTNLLDHAAGILSKTYCKTMNLPCLIISAACDQKANIAQARLLTEKLRFADNLIIPAAAPALLQASAWQRNQLWAAFDAFIPGSDMTIANNALEHAVLL